MAAAAITANYEIAHNLKSIQLRDPIFFPIPMFSRVRNAMKLSFAFYDLSNYLKFQNGRRNWRFQTYSRGVILLFYDHSNYLKIMWELQIDVSIIYSLNIWNGTENIFKTALILGYFRLKSLNFGPKSGLKSLIFHH